MDHEQASMLSKTCMTRQWSLRMKAFLRILPLKESRKWSKSALARSWGQSGASETWKHTRNVRPRPFIWKAPTTCQNATCSSIWRTSSTRWVQRLLRGCPRRNQAGWKSQWQPTHRKMKSTKTQACSALWRESCYLINPVRRSKRFHNLLWQLLSFNWHLEKQI